MKTTQKRSKMLLAGIGAMVLAFGLVFTGCDFDNDDNNTGGDGGNTVATPSANPVAGAVTAGTIVSLSSTTAGATIYYTTDGSTPTPIEYWGSPLYETPIAVNTAVTIKAIAVKEGMMDSGILSAAYTIKSGDGTPSDNVYVGVVAFNDSVTTSEISNDLGKAKSFITSKTNNVDKTALCYAVSKAIPLFDKAGLPSFDYTYIVTFTDGADNGSSSLYVTDGQSITQTGVYNKANADLSGRAGLKSYAIGFTGNEAINATDMQKLVIGGQYKTANSSSDLDAVFKSIADSVLASSKNVTLRTNTGLFTEAEPKYIRLTITSAQSLDSYYTYSDTITGKLVYNMGQSGATPVFTVTASGSYTIFDAPVTGTVSSGKILLPLNNLKQVRSGMEYFIRSIKVEVGWDGETWRVDTEDSSTSEDISKTIGVVLVMDCSASLGTEFLTVQSAANNFIDTLNGE